MEKLENGHYTGERALFQMKDAQIIDGIFEDGESPLKGSCNLELSNCSFKWKYPLWYVKDVKVNDCKWFEMARAGVWYTKNVTVQNALIDAPKNFRRCNDLTLKGVQFTDASETLWHCEQVKMEDVTAKGDYFAMNSHDLKIDHLTLDGNYPFDGGYNIEIRNSKLLSKDAFWNSENVTVYDSYISGEYIGWNSKNLTFVNCTIESLQGFCYIENLTIKNCKLPNTTLTFEYSSVEADIDGKIDSVLNPSSGTISCDEIGELILQKDQVNLNKVHISCKQIDKTSDQPEWLK